ncbi:MAG: HTH domain-containing protein [bacterium]
MLKWNKEKITSAIKKRYKKNKFLDSKGLLEENPSLYYACYTHFGNLKTALEAAKINPLTVKKHPQKQVATKKTSSKIQRMLTLIYYMNNHLGVTSDFLAKKLNVTTRTIHRYIKELRSIPDIEITYIDRFSGYEVRFSDEKNEIYNDRHMYIWTSKDLKILEFLSEQGVSDEKIAQLLERTIQSVRTQKYKMDV